MAAKPKSKTSSKKKVFEIEYEYDETVRYDCPIRGKVAQKVRVKRYESPSYIPLFDADTETLESLVQDMMYGEIDKPA